MNANIDLNAMLAGYLECALWSSTGDDGEPLDDQYFPTDISEESQKSARVDMACFIADCTENDVDLDEWYAGNSSRIGHDLWLTRNHHGAGFWDRGFREAGDRMTSIAHDMGGVDAYVGDSGHIYFT